MHAHASRGSREDHVSWLQRADLGHPVDDEGDVENQELRVGILHFVVADPRSTICDQYNSSKESRLGNLRRNLCQGPQVSLNLFHDPDSGFNTGFRSQNCILLTKSSNSKDQRQ